MMFRVEKSIETTAHIPNSSDFSNERQKNYKYFNYVKLAFYSQICPVRCSRFQYSVLKYYATYYQTYCERINDAVK